MSEPGVSEGLQGQDAQARAALEFALAQFTGDSGPEDWHRRVGVPDGMLPRLVEGALAAYLLEDPTGRQEWADGGEIRVRLGHLVVSLWRRIHVGSFLAEADQLILENRRGYQLIPVAPKDFTEAQAEVYLALRSPRSPDALSVGDALLAARGVLVTPSLAHSG